MPEYIDSEVKEVGSAELDNSGIWDFEEPMEEAEVEEPKVEEQAEVVPQPSVAEEIRRGFESLKEKPEPQAQGPVELTPEQKAEVFGMFEVDEALVKGIFDADDPRAGLTVFRDKIIRQAMKSANVIAELKAREILERVNPMLQATQQQEAVGLRDRMVAKYPGLQGQDELIGMVAMRLASRGENPKNEDEMFGMVAKEVEKIVKKYDKNFSAGAGAAKVASAPANGSRPSMAGTVSGGQGTSEKAPKKPVNSGIW